MLNTTRKHIKRLAIRCVAVGAAAFVSLARALRPQKEGVYFCYNQSIHHIHHTLFIAIELSNIQDEFPVKVLSTSQEATDIIRAALKIIPNRIHFKALVHPGYARRDYSVNWFVFLCRLQMHHPRGVVVTEYFDNVFRQLGVKTRWFFTSHGPENRGFSHPHVRDYDLVFCASEGDAQRIKNLIGEFRNYQARGYSKFDYFHHPRSAVAASLFSQQRPVVVYNPHFDPKVSSFYAQGPALLKALSATDRYNILFLPHPDLSRKYPRALKDLAGLPNTVLVERPPTNLEYLAAADIYITDVSSAAYEWLYFRKPLVIFNPLRLDNDGGRLFHVWRCAPVTTSISEVMTALEHSLQHPQEGHDKRAAMFQETFVNTGQPVSRQIAQAILSYLQTQGPCPR